MNTVLLDGLPFVLRRSGQRRTVEITVERDGTLVFQAPEDVSLEVLGQLVNQRRQWIYDRLGDKGSPTQLCWHREYVSGEGFYYLGRSYRLKIVDGGEELPALRLFRSRFELRRDAQAEGRGLFTCWYASRLRRRLPAVVGAFAPRVGREYPTVHVRDLGYRWGSCGRNGALYFHWRLVMLPLTVIEYIAAHETVHLVERSHSAAFRERLERLMPDWEDRAQWLTEKSAQYDL